MHPVRLYLFGVHCTGVYREKCFLKLYSCICTVIVKKSYSFFDLYLLSLPTVWSQWGNPEVTRCREMATLPVGYIPQCKVPSASSSGSLDFIVCEVL